MSKWSTEAEEMRTALTIQQCFNRMPRFSKNVQHAAFLVNMVQVVILGSQVFPALLVLMEHKEDPVLRQMRHAFQNVSLNLLRVYPVLKDHGARLGILDSLGRLAIPEYRGDQAKTDYLEDQARKEHSDRKDFRVQMAQLEIKV